MAVVGPRPAPDVPQAEPEAGETIFPTPSWVKAHDRRYQRFLDLYENDLG